MTDATVCPGYKGGLAMRAHSVASAPRSSRQLLDLARPSMAAANFKSLHGRRLAIGKAAESLARDLQ
jgi:hypothetical protein